MLTYEFYRALADGYPVDGALAEARKAIYRQPGHNFEWGTPVLFMRAADGRLFKIEGVGEEPLRFFRHEKLITERFSQFTTWQRMLANRREARFLMKERMSEFVEYQDVPLQLIRNLRRTEAQITDLERKLSLL